MIEFPVFHTKNIDLWQKGSKYGYSNIGIMMHMLLKR